MSERTGHGDPVVVLPLLWRRGGRTGRSGLTLDTVVEAGIAFADENGIDQLSMRKLASRVGAGAMTLYSYVPGRSELIDLMVDRVFGELTYGDALSGAASWRAALEVVAERNWDLLARHRWLVHVDLSRPPLGPGTIAKYDAELGALAGAGLDDVTVDQALSLLLGHVTASARQTFTAAPSPGLSTDDIDDTDEAWWEGAGPLLASLIEPGRYPLATRIGQAAGEAYGAAADHRRAYEFGLRTILDGIEVLVSGLPDSERAVRASDRVDPEEPPSGTQP